MPNPAALEHASPTLATAVAAKEGKLSLVARERLARWFSDDDDDDDDP